VKNVSTRGRSLFKALRCRMDASKEKEASADKVEDRHEAGWHSIAPIVFFVSIPLASRQSQGRATLLSGQSHVNLGTQRAVMRFFTWRHIDRAEKPESPPARRSRKRIRVS